MVVTLISLSISSIAIFRHRPSAFVDSPFFDIFFAIPINVIIGIFTFRAARHLRQIVTTEGEDITQLLLGMKQLSVMFRRYRVMIIIAIIMISYRFLH